MRLIDATKLEDLLRRQMEMDWNKQAAPASWSAAYEQILAELGETPVVDAVPVVRCEDCVYYNKDVQNFNDYYRCDRYALWQSVDERVHMPLDGFCNYGERKGESERRNENVE